ncbi:hypothetical protein HUJ05_007613 [Dendroctonus ponderosae]|nr:hypothetical protein HUJ05_007613 [Dendroctonus ponderosae]
MSDAWEEIQAVQRKRNSLRERLEKRKKERRDILGSSLHSCNSSDLASSTSAPGLSKEEVKPKNEDGFEAQLLKVDPELEKELLRHLADVTLQLPMCSFDLVATLKTSASHKQVSNLLQKFATQKLILVKDTVRDGVNTLDVASVEVSKVNAMIAELFDEQQPNVGGTAKRKREEAEAVESLEEERRKKEKKEPKTDILSLLSMPSTKEKETKKIGEEILVLLSKPTAKERSLTERFKSQDIRPIDLPKLPVSSAIRPSQHKACKGNIKSQSSC